jgi:hypothetical protein
MARKKPQRDLADWTDEDWDYAGKEGDSRYLPKRARQSLTSSQKAAGNKRKRQANRRGKQYADYTEAELRAVRNATR